MPITSTFKFLAGVVVSDSVTSAVVVGIVCIGAAMWATTRVHETFHSDMDFVEQ